MMKLNKLALGSVQFGLNYGINNLSGQTSVEEVEQIVMFAKKNGINLIDTASGYGEAEKVLGTVRKYNLEYVSKFMSTENGDDIEKQLTISLNNLKVEKLYGYLAHRPLSLLKHEEYWDELLQFKKDGKVQKIGYSLNEVVEYEQLMEKGYVPDLVQVPFNYFDNRFIKAMEELKALGCEIHTRSTFLQGLFFKDVNSLSPFFKELKTQLKYLQETHQDTLQGVLLNYVISNKFVDKVVLGIENKLQLEQNILQLENAIMLPELNQKFSDNVVMPSCWPK